MINKNFKCLKRSTRQIADELKISPTTANKYIKDALFEKSFAVPSFYDVCKEESKRRTKGEMPQKASIRYKIKLSIYHPIKLCIKNFQKLSFLEKEYLAQETAKESKHITGSAILEYNQSILKDIFSDKGDLQDFQKNMLKNHKSVKYATVMDIYYNRFLDDISFLTALGIDGSVTDNPDNFAKTIASLEEIIWHFTLNRSIERDTDDSSQFNINNALRDVICEIDGYYDEKDDNYDEKSEKISKKEYNEQLKRIEPKYFERVQKHFTENLNKNIDIDKDTFNFYNSLKEREVFDDAYHEEYLTFFHEYIIEGDQLKAIKKFLSRCTDIYGRMFIPGCINDADNILRILDGLISLIKANHKIKISDISSSDMCTLRCNFIYIKKAVDTYNCYTEFYNDEVQTYTSIAYEGDIFKDIDNEDLRKNHAPLICKFCSFLCGEKAEITISDEEADIIDYYFKHCIYIHICSDYFNYIEAVNKNFKQIKRNLSSTALYKNIKNNIDASIAVKWADSIFENTK